MLPHGRAEQSALMPAVSVFFVLVYLLLLRCWSLTAAYSSVSADKQAAADPLADPNRLVSGKNRPVAGVFKRTHFEIASAYSV